MLTEHLRTVGGANFTQIVGLRPIGASHNSTLTFTAPAMRAHAANHPRERRNLQRHGPRPISAAYLTRLHNCADAVNRLSKLVNHPWVLSTLFFAAKMAERAPWISICCQ